jgi:hypothetical protein
VLEIASGSGEHAAFFAAGLPRLTWQPDSDPRARDSIAALGAASSPANLLAPLALDAPPLSPWPVASAAAVARINMIHIWSAGAGLTARARSTLRDLGDEAALAQARPGAYRDVAMPVNNRSVVFPRAAA